MEKNKKAIKQIKKAFEPQNLRRVLASMTEALLDSD